MRATRPLRLLALPWLVAVFALQSGAAGAAVASPQEPSVQVDQEQMKLRGLPIAELERILQRRDREHLHIKSPIELIGLEEGDNEFRSATPLLEEADRSEILVDTDENYRRRLAMYEEGAVFNRPLNTASGRSAWASDSERSSTRPSAESEPADDGFGFGFVFFVALISLATTLGWKYRYHFMP